ncbi:Zn-dependent hydrolase [Carnimonas bestiolae]|uniref:Zn-dependent hydrolase n=1 Tax=Carnimonas bestiolae TaxID=3402172 RepID=UPI003EDC58D5
MSQSPRANAERLWQSLRSMSDIGATPAGGVTRLTLTKLDGEARDLFVGWAKEAGCTIRIDPFGNIFARREGRRPDLPPVVIGSHLDTQPAGGNYDGVYGVLAALEVVRALNDAQLDTERSIEVVSWTNEEGARFQPPMLGSGVFTGVFSLDFGLSLTDKEGIRLGDALSDIGYAGTDHIAATSIHAALEVHIEQGPVLEKEAIDIGVVTGAQGQRRYEIQLTGQSAHAGTTPLDYRADAALGLARSIEAVRRIGIAQGEAARATVGYVSLSPNSPNVVAGGAVFSVEFRHVENNTLDIMEEALLKEIQQIADDTKLEHSVERIIDYAPISFDSRMVDLVEQTAKQYQYSYKRMVSGAGHDACYLSRVTPTAMIFIPCVDGISHNEAEQIYPNWAEAGANVLLGAALAKANDVEK